MSLKRYSYTIPIVLHINKRYSYIIPIVLHINKRYSYIIPIVLHINKHKWNLWLGKLSNINYTKNVRYFEFINII